MSTSKILQNGGSPIAGTLTINFAEQSIDAILFDMPAALSFDLWLVKNIPGGGRSIKPEIGDQFVKLGSFAHLSGSTGQELTAVVGNAVSFDFDLVVVTAAGQPPDANVAAIGARTLFEKRFFRERAGGSLDPVTGAESNAVETNDPLVARGAQLFFNEQFAGNGRTCGTCHPATHNLTIDPAFIATLPANDALFVAETNPDLAGLEDPALLRGHALVRENVDGFEDPTHKFVQRGVPHTFAMSTSISADDFAESDQKTGWSGDGAPGRATLNEFALGAIFQHFTKTLQRRPGIDFRIPTQEEVDAIEAFQLFSGRQHNPHVDTIAFSDAHAQSGKDLFMGSQGRCSTCHQDLIGKNANILVNTGINNLPFRTQLGLPSDGGFGTTPNPNGGFGFNGDFNVPPLVEAADTPPFFHNNAFDTIEDAVSFYTSDTFAKSQGPLFAGGQIVLNQGQINDIAAFLRVINAAENIRQVRKRVQFVQANRSPGNDDVLKIAIGDTNDAIRVLSERGLNPHAVTDLQTVLQTLQIAAANADSARPDFMNTALAFLGLAKQDLFTQNPNSEF